MIADKKTRIENICAYLVNLYRDKNAAYGDAFGKTFKEMGIISAVTRMTDKMERIKSLCLGGEEYGESMMDTLHDLALYAMMTIVERQLQGPFEVEGQTYWPRPDKEWGEEAQSCPNTPLVTPEFFMFCPACRTKFTKLSSFYQHYEASCGKAKK
jgi:hypothetical protein